LTLLKLVVYFKQKERIKTMSKNDWLEALNRETRENATFAYLWAMVKLKLATLQEAISAGSESLQKSASARRKTQRANTNRRMRDDAMRSCGLTKVYGSVSGKVYWE